MSFAREKVFAKLAQCTAGAGAGTGTGASASIGNGSGSESGSVGGRKSTNTIDFSALIAEAGGVADKVEFVCQYMLKRVKLF